MRFFYAPMITFFALCSGFLLPPMALSGSEQWSGEAALARFEPFRSQFASLNTISAHFEQKPLDDPLAEDTQKGNFFAIKPNRMRWEYDGQAGQFLVVDGNRVWLALPKDEQVYTEPLAKSRYGTFLKAFFGDQKALESLFNDQASLQHEDGKWSLVVAPSDKESDLTRMTFGWHTESPWMETLTFENRNGQKSQMTFTAVESKSKLPPEKFTYTPPKGYQILDFQGERINREDLK